MKVTTAVIMAAGYGTRMLPVTASIPKVLLPILNRPVVDYVVDDCIAAGITNIIFVINAGSHSLQDFYSENPSLDAHLNHFDKMAVREVRC
jgi:UTP--glucose-1-phosphate uridylyltransferase